MIGREGGKQGGKDDFYIHSGTRNSTIRLNSNIRQGLGIKIPSFTSGVIP